MALKQIAQPNAEQVQKLKAFVHQVMWKNMQLPEFAVRQSIFWYKSLGIGTIQNIRGGKYR